MCGLLLATSSFFVGFETAPASASMKREEARETRNAEAQQLEAEGWGKLREAIIGSEAEGFLQTS